MQVQTSKESSVLLVAGRSCIQTDKRTYTNELPGGILTLVRHIGQVTKNDCRIQAADCRLEGKHHAVDLSFHAACPQHWLCAAIPDRRQSIHASLSRLFIYRSIKSPQGAGLKAVGPKASGLCAADSIAASAGGPICPCGCAHRLHDPSLLLVPHAGDGISWMVVAAAEGEGETAERKQEVGVAEEVGVSRQDGVSPQS